MRRAGSVLVLALWTLLVLGFLAVAVGGYVSANIQIANHVKYEARAYHLAKAGVSLAISEIMLNPTNAKPSLFTDNESLPNGTFSISSQVLDTNTASIVTKPGWLGESAKVDIDYASDNNRNALVELLTLQELGESSAEELVEEILVNYTNSISKKEIDPKYREKYGFYDTPAQLFAVEGVDRAIFEKLEPHVTIRQFLRWYKSSSGRPINRESYGAMAEGKAFGDDGVAAIRRIAFVFDRATTNILYWREH